MTQHAQVPSSSNTALTGSQLLEQFRPEMSAIPRSEVLTPRVDAATAATVAIGSMPAIELYREPLVARFGDEARVALDRVVPTAKALLAAEASDRAVAAPDLDPKVAALRAQRDALAASAASLIERGVVDKKTLSKLVGGSSYGALSVDTVTLAQWFRAHASEIAGQSVVTEEELVQAEQAAEGFVEHVAARQFRGAGVTVTEDERARAFTLFFRNYETVANMLAYLRWHEGDADQIAQTIYQRKRSRREDDASSSTPVVTGPPVAPGMPGGNPFQS